MQRLTYWISAALVSITLSGCDEPKTSVSDGAEAVLGPPSSTVSEGGMIGQTRPAFSLPDLSGTVRSIAEWDGKVIVLNFWATWCPPCRKEMPMFVEMQETYGERGLQFIGVAIDDVDKVQDFADTFGVDYPMLVGSLDAIEIGKQYGNRFGALPYSLVIDRTGKIVLAHRGELDRELLETTIGPLL